MAKRLGWSGLIYDATWCRFVENQDGIYLSDDRLMCETLNDEISLINVECDDLLQTDISGRTCHILFKQKVTGKEWKNTVFQNSGGTIVYSVDFYSDTIGDCTTYDEFLSLISVTKQINDDVIVLDDSEYTVVYPSRSEYVTTSGIESGITYDVQAFIHENGIMVTGEVTRSGSTPIIVTSTTMQSLDIQGTIVEHHSTWSEEISYSGCPCVTVIQGDSAIGASGGSVTFEIHKYDCIPNIVIHHKNVDIETSAISGNYITLTEYIGTSPCDGSPVSYSAVTESGYTSLKSWEVLNNQEQITPIQGDFDEDSTINITADNEVESFNLKLTAEYSGMTASKIITINL